LLSLPALATIERLAGSAKAAVAKAFGVNGVLNSEMWPETERS
jgi:hypothetical protein